MIDLALTAAAPWEAWRWWTGHIVHYSAAHATLNAIAAIPPLLLYRRGALRWMAVSAPLISVGILILAAPAEYRGASALVVGLWFYSGIARGAYWLVAVAAAKLVLELFHPLAAIEVPLPLAHWLGAAAGVVGARVHCAHARRAPAEMAPHPPDRGGEGRNGQRVDEQSHALAEAEE